MGSGGSSKMGLNPVRPEGNSFSLGSYSQKLDFDPDVKLGGSAWDLQSGGNNLSATNKETGKTVSGKDYKEKKDFKMSPISMSQSSPENYMNYGFSPQMSMGYGDPTSMTELKSGAIWGDKENEDSLEQFLQWQRKMGY